MNRKISALLLVLVSLAVISWTACDNDSDDRSAPTPVIVATSGTPQSAAPGAAFAAPLVATVTKGSTPVTGATVTFTAPASGASGTFVNTTATDTETTNASGVATSTAFTANATAGTYTVTAAVSGATTNASFILTNTAAVAVSTYAFYITGLEGANSGPNFYAVAGAFSIDANGNVIAGEQDYNDAAGFTSPQPSGDTITGGGFLVNGAGQGTLTLITNNENLGVSGTETLGVQFANINHALVIQFDGSGTSSGSLDLQTLPSTLSGGYAFTLTGVDAGYLSAVAGGVFSVSGTNLQNGIIDLDDFGAEGTPTLGTAFTGTISAADALGRGTITNTGLATTFNYYIVGSEAIRIIDVDATDALIGSAFGQGSGTFSDASLPNSVFAVQSNSWGVPYAAAGMINTSQTRDESTTLSFFGVADADEVGSVVSAVPISGTFAIASNGYGSLAITSGNLDQVSNLGIYMTDPNLNLNDPNNTTSGLGGALVADLDGFNLNGTGVLTPQTDTATASFAGLYAFGAQQFYPGGEFDFVGLGNISSLALTGTGLLSDPSGDFEGPSTYAGVSFSGTAAPDLSNPGRYTIPFTIALDGFAPFNVVIYQASGTQLYWLDADGGSIWLGPLEQQVLPGRLSRAKKAWGKFAKRKAK